MTSLTNLFEKITGDLADKRRYRVYRARVNALPAPYRTAVRAVERFLVYFSPMAKGDVLVAMLVDLADLFEQGAADGTPIRSIVGEDPVAFAEDFQRNYADGQWINKERSRLVAAIENAIAEEQR